jgi:hypothetical protein
MTATANENSNPKKIPPEVQAELDAANNRADQAESEAATLRAQRTQKVIVEAGPIKRMMLNIGITGVAAISVAAGAVLGVGGTVVVQRRRNRTAVGSTGEAGTMEHSEQM